MTDASCNDEQSQNTPSQEYIPPPSNQLLYSPHLKVEVQKLPPGNPGSHKNKSLEEIISQFVLFDPSQNLTQPLEGEAERDKTFIHDQAVELLEIMLETWAWSVSRVVHTTQTASARLDGQFATAMNAEKEQGMSNSPDSARLQSSAFRLPSTALFDAMCKRLQEFVHRMRSAIDVLRGI